jgi:kynurenine/2-aminoadipate aminotransferase
VPCDGGGLIPDALAALLDTWPARAPKPKALYTIPCGGNPTGATLTVERKRAIYDIARRHNILILEDDPYYWMQFSPERTPSFLSMDVDGRVLRFDSLSKLVSSGLRVGFVTGPAPLVEKIELHAQAAVLHGSGASQALVAGLFDAWARDAGSAHAGFAAHCRGVCDFYLARRDHFLKCADAHLTGLAEWTAPAAGMFVWLDLPVADSDVFIKTKCRDAKVLLVPGQSFDPADAPSSHARASFSTASFDDIDRALERLGALLRAELESPGDRTA